MPEYNALYNDWLAVPPTYKERFVAEFGEEAWRHWEFDPPRGNYFTDALVKEVRAAQRDINKQMARLIFPHTLDENSTSYWTTTVKRVGWYTRVARAIKRRLRRADS